MESRSSFFLVSLLFLVSAAGAILWAETGKQRDQEARAEAFQRLVGGVGFGPALDLSGCAFSFDPRLDRSCSADSGPISGGACFCPRHAGSLFSYPPLRKREDRVTGFVPAFSSPRTGKGDPDAALP
jgi:hypothetical protein